MAYSNILYDYKSLSDTEKVEKILEKYRDLSKNDPYTLTFIAGHASILTNAIRFFIMTNNATRVIDLLKEALQLHSVVNHEVTLEPCVIILTNCRRFFRQEGLVPDAEFCERELKRIVGEETTK